MQVDLRFSYFLPFQLNKHAINDYECQEYVRLHVGPTAVRTILEVPYADLVHLHYLLAAAGRYENAAVIMHIIDQVRKNPDLLF